MKKFFWSFYFLAFAFFIGIIFWTQPEPVPAAPSVVMEILDPSLQQFAKAWQKEIGRRFPNAVGVLCHGGNFVGDQWIVTATSFGRYLIAQDIARFEKTKYPGKTIVLLCCNPGHLDLGIKGVYFADDSVWAIPDRDVDQMPGMERWRLMAARHSLPPKVKLSPPSSKTLLSRWSEEPGLVGNIFEFNCD